MVGESRRLEYWRKYFRSANGGIFDVIEHAILVAASDCADEFQARRDRIAETLFSCLLARCHGCEKVKSRFLDEEDEDAFVAGEADVGGVGDIGYVEGEKMLTAKGDEEVEDLNRVSNYSYDEAEALTEEMEEEGMMYGEVTRIKEILDNEEHEPHSQLLESLRKLQLMAISVETLKTTDIGKSVNALRRHASKEIRCLVRTLIDGWKVLVDEWVRSTVALTENTPESANPSVVDNDEGLPSPPLDEGFLFSAQTTMELSQFFDGMDDDDGNTRNHDESKRSWEIGRNPAERCNNSTGKRQILQSSVSENMRQMKEQEAPSRQAKPQGVVDKQMKVQEVRRRQNQSQEDFSRQHRHLEAVNSHNKQSSSVISAGPGRPKNAQERTGLQKKPLTGQDKSKNSEEMIAHAKLEDAKRKIHEGYQRVEDAKRQRTIQVLELQDLPKPRPPFHKQPLPKRGNNRFRSNGRH